VAGDTHLARQALPHGGPVGPPPGLETHTEGRAGGVQGCLQTLPRTGMQGALRGMAL